jgi:hypothetical protein
VASPDVPWYDWPEDEDDFEVVQARRKAECPRLTATQLECLWQLRMTVWDGYLISKATRTWLVDHGLAARLSGWQFITREGMAVLDVYGLLKDDRYGTRGTGAEHGTSAGDKLWTLKPEQFARLREEGLLT